jgi:hypothetical protein
MRAQKHQSHPLKLSWRQTVSCRMGFRLCSALTRGFGGSNGGIADIGTYMPMPGSTDIFLWFAGPSVSLADSTNMNRWLDVRAAKRPYPATILWRERRTQISGSGGAMVWFIDKHFHDLGWGAEHIFSRISRTLRLLSASLDQPPARAFSRIRLGRTVTIRSLWRHAG